MIKNRSFMAFLCCIFLLLCPAETFAAEERGDGQYFRVRIDSGQYDCIGPGDTMEETFYIKSLSDEQIKVRLCEVRNISQSPLYRVLRVRWNQERDVPFASFAELKKNWLSLSPDETIELNLEMYFPSELGNAYQNQWLTAEFVFECRGSEKEAENHIWIETDAAAPKTGDKGELAKYVFIAWCAVIAAYVCKKRPAR